MTKKRKLFNELMEGVDAMQQQHEGKITLRSHEVEDLPPLEVDADLIRDTRERLTCFPCCFCTSPACIPAYFGELGTGSRQTECSSVCSHSDGSEISGHTRETELVGKPSCLIGLESISAT